MEHSITDVEIIDVQTDRGKILQYKLIGGVPGYEYFYEQWFAGNREMGPNHGRLKPGIVTKAGTRPGKGDFIIKIYTGCKSDVGLGLIPEGPILFEKSFTL